MSKQLPIAILGAGPVGLAAAAHLCERDVPFVIFEAGESVGAVFAALGRPEARRVPVARADVQII